MQTSLSIEIDRLKMVIRPKNVAVTEYIQTSVTLDGNPEPDLVHATGCKQPTLRD
jgi:hypothetical protein